jgi:hypothetical protein
VSAEAAGGCEEVGAVMDAMRARLSQPFEMDRNLLRRKRRSALAQGFIASDGLPRVINCYEPGQIGLWLAWPIEVLVDGVVATGVFYASRETGEVCRVCDLLAGRPSLVLSGRLEGEVIHPKERPGPVWERLRGKVEFRWREGFP